MMRNAYMRGMDQSYNCSFFVKFIYWIKTLLLKERVVCF